jgi:hypothetical protein
VAPLTCNWTGDVDGEGLRVDGDLLAVLALRLARVVAALGGIQSQHRARVHREREERRLVVHLQHVTPGIQKKRKNAN